MNPGETFSFVGRQLLAQGQLQFIMDATDGDYDRAVSLYNDSARMYASWAAELFRKIKQGELGLRDLTKLGRNSMLAPAPWVSVFVCSRATLGKLLSDFEVTVAATTAEEAKAQDEKELATWKEQFTEFQAQKERLRQDLNVIAQVLHENIRFQHLTSFQSLEVGPGFTRPMSGQSEFDSGTLQPCNEPKQHFLS
jgi:hypothetical protein